MTEEKEECKTAIESMNFIASHIKKVADMLDAKSVTNFVDEIMSSKRIFLMGAGRSGFVVRAFAMRLMHLGFNAYVIGEVTTPAVKPEDLVIAISGAGETPLIVKLGKVAKTIGSKLATVTSNKGSTLANTSDIVVVIPGKNKEDIYETKLAPLGTMFELTTLVFLDGVISELMERKGVSEEDMSERHMLSVHVGML